MTQKFNFFLNEYVNNSDLREIDKNSHNIILNGIFLTKIQKTKIIFKTPINYINHDDVGEIIKEKKKFDDFIRSKLPYLIYENLKKNIVLDSSISYAIERLFFHYNNSIFDLNLFFSQNFIKLKNSEITIYYGGEYRLTETLFFLYFISLVSSLDLKKIIFIYRDRKTSLKKFNNIDDFLEEFLSKETLINKKYNLNNKNCKNILFTEGLRYRNFWIEKLNPLKVSSRENFSENFISFKQSSKLTLSELELYKKFRNEKNMNPNKLANKDKNMEFILNFFSNFLLNIIAKRFQIIENFCNENLDFNKFDNLFIPAAPLFEIIPIVNEMKKRNKNIFLIPHSSTPSFEYHPDTYKNQITFISAKKIMPSSNWHKENNQKILIIPRTFFHSGTNIEKKTKNYFLNLKKYNVHTELKFIISKTLILFSDKIKYLFQNYLLNYFLKPSNNVGLILNVEIYENLVDIDYNKQNDIISELFDLCINKRLNLIIRRKPGWTNYFFLKKKLSKKFLKDKLKSLILLQDEFSINEFLRKVNVSIFFQGTTAIYDSIKNGTPCIFLIDPKLLLMNEQYVDFPEDIVPKLSIAEINNVISDKIYLKNLLDKQLQFIKNEEEVNVRKINNFTELNI